MGPFIITGKIGVWRELRFLGGSPSGIRFQCLKANYLHTKHKQPPYKRTVGFPLRSKLNDWSNSNFFSHKTPTCNKDFVLFSTYFWFSGLFSFFESVRLFYKMILTQRGEEETDNTACNPKVTFEQGKKTFI